MYNTETKMSTQSSLKVISNGAINRADATSYLVVSKFQVSIQGGSDGGYIGIYTPQISLP